MKVRNRNPRLYPFLSPLPPPATGLYRHHKHTGSSLPSIASLVKLRLYFLRVSPLGTASGLTHELPPAPGMENSLTPPKNGEEEGDMPFPRISGSDDDDDEGRAAAAAAAWLARAEPRRKGRVFL